jgi:hypothetical protein
MKTDYYHLFFCAFLILGCESSNDANFEPEIEEEMEEPNPWDGAILNFIAEGPDGTSYTPDEGPIVINEGQSVIYISTSSDVPQGVSWNDGLLNGLESAILNEISITVNYDTEGKYAISLLNNVLNADLVADYPNVDFSEIPEVQLTLIDYVCVVPEPVVPCILESVDSGDGLFTLHIFENDVIVRADKSDDEILQEYSEYDYDPLGRLFEERFFTPNDELLGRRVLTYNDEDKLEKEVIRSASGDLVSETTFVHEPIRIKGFYVGGDGSTYEVQYNYNEDKTNIKEEVYEQNGNQFLRIEYEFDDKLNLSTGLDFLRFPERAMTNNITKKTTYDGDDNVTELVTSEFQFLGSDPCADFANSEERTRNDVTTIRTYTFKQQ